MSFDGLMFKRITDLLNEEIGGSFINKISQVSGSDFVFTIYKNKKLQNLMIATNNSASYITLFNDKFEKVSENTHFLSLLYHHVCNGVITSLEQINNDRILRMNISRKDELGIKKDVILFIELTGKATNIILTRDDLTIIDALHRVSPLANRGIVSGLKYYPPEIQQLGNPFIDPYNDKVSIKEQYSGFSTTLLKEFEYRLGNGESFKNIIESINTSTNIYIYNKDYHLIPLMHLNEEPVVLDYKEGIYTFYKNNNKKSTVSDEHKEITKVINRQIKHLSGKLVKLNDELSKSSDAELYNHYGDLIFTYCENLDAKLSSISINDEDTSTIIKLDSTITVKENALKFYKKYQKLRNSKEVLKEQIEISQNSLDYYKFLLIQVADSSNSELDAIKQELIDQHVIKSASTQKKKNNQNKFMEFEIEGIKVLVGKNNYQNEMLTHKLAKYDEYFFHVKDYAGSHVIVRTNQQLNENIIRFAANLAAYYSSARESSSVPVDYTQVKNVKRHPQNVPGKVILKNYKTIYIDPVEPK